MFISRCLRRLRTAPEAGGGEGRGAAGEGRCGSFSRGPGRWGGGAVLPNRGRGRSRRVYGSALRLGLDAAGGKIVEGLGRLREKKKPKLDFSHCGSGSDFVSPGRGLG